MSGSRPQPGLVRRGLVFLPSLVLGVSGGVWLLLRGGSGTPRLGLGWQLGLGVAAGVLLLAAAWLLERRLPSFRYASRLMEDALRTLALPRWAGPALAAVTAVGEELFFRGALLPVVGVPGQALLFGLFHPVPPRGWAYPAFAALAGLLFGWMSVASGSLLPAMTAHFVINLQGFWQAGGAPTKGDATGAADGGAGDGGVPDAPAHASTPDAGSPDTAPPPEPDA